jgi:hypothetical protein
LIQELGEFLDENGISEPLEIRFVGGTAVASTVVKALWTWTLTFDAEARLE